MKQLVVVLASFWVAAAGCGTGPDDPNLIYYQFELSAFGGDTTSERIRAYDCIVSGSFSGTGLAPPNGTVTFPVWPYGESRCSC